MDESANKPTGTPPRDNANTGDKRPAGVRDESGAVKEAKLMGLYMELMGCSESQARSAMMLVGLPGDGEESGAD